MRHDKQRPALCEPLENRLLCRIAINGGFVIIPTRCAGKNPVGYSARLLRTDE